MKRRRLLVRVPKPGVLLAQWGRDASREPPDLIYAYGDGVPRADMHILHNTLSCVRYVGAGQFSPSFIDELKARGYDITTLRFSVQKLEVQ